MVKFIVLESNIGSMTELQIIGRGTRIREADGKVFFTIMDFRKATNLFDDPAFVGDPVQIYEPKGDEPVTPPEDTVNDGPTKNGSNQNGSAPGSETIIPSDDTDEVKKYYVNNVSVTIASERVQYYGKDGNLITESLKKYSKEKLYFHMAGSK